MTPDQWEIAVTLVGGPLDGWPLVIRGALPDQLRLPYSHEMLRLAGASIENRASLRERWLNVTFPTESEADGIALYHRVADFHAPRYTFVGHPPSGRHSQSIIRP